MILIKILAGVFCRNWQADSQIYMEMQKLRSWTKIILGNKALLEDSLLDTKTNHKATEISGN